MKITLEHLRDACEDQRELFAQIFPDGAPLTKEAMEKAVACGLRVIWLEHLLTESAWKQYDALRRDQCGPAILERFYYSLVSGAPFSIADDALMRPAWKRLDAIRRRALLAALQLQFKEEE